jgi:hypothetical protein
MSWMADDGDAQFKSLRANMANRVGVIVHSQSTGKEPLPLYTIVASDLSCTSGMSCVAGTFVRVCVRAS